MPTHDLIFYDGRCGLCHRVVRRVLDAGPAGERFLVSPLQGQTIREQLTDAQRAALPDTVVVKTRDGRLLMHSDAALYILEHLGERYQRQARLLRRVPRPLRQLGYRLVSINRQWLFRRPSDLCPMMTPQQRARCLK